MPFWRAALGYEPRRDSPAEDLVDPRGRWPGFWFEQMNNPRADGGGAIHVAIWVPYEHAEARIAAAHYRIAVLVARPPQQVAAELAGEVPLPQLPDSVATPPIVDVIRARPDLRGAEDRVVASRELVRAARADYMPRISIAGAAGYTANEVDAVGGAGTFNYAIGPVISWPAFDIGRVKARVDQAQAEERETRIRHEQLVLLAQEQVEATAVRYRTARARLEHLRAAAEASERAAELARLRFEGGISDFLQVLDAERTLLVAQDQLAQGRTAATDAYVDLYEARGARWPDARTTRPLGD